MARSTSDLPASIDDPDALDLLLTENYALVSATQAQQNAGRLHDALAYQRRLGANLQALVDAFRASPRGIELAPGAADGAAGPGGGADGAAAARDAASLRGAAAREAPPAAPAAPPAAAPALPAPPAAPPHAPPPAWMAGINEPASGLLAALGLSEYERLFEDNAIDMAALELLSRDDLKGLGLPLGAVVEAAAVGPLVRAADGPAGGRLRRRSYAGASILLPLADDGGRLEGLLRGRRSYWRRAGRGAAALAVAGGALGGGGDPPRPPPPLPEYAGACPAAAGALLDAIDAELARGAGFRAARGGVDWGLVEAGGDGGGACNNAASGCAANNPSAPYGLVVLPLAPSEILVAKLRSNFTPPYVVENLQDAELYGGGRSPVWQLGPGEVVVVAGCAPAEEASRYFAATGYLYSQYSPSDAGWLTTFASLGDSLSTARTPGGLRPRPAGAPPPAAAYLGRLNATRLGRGGGGGGGGLGDDVSGGAANESLSDAGGGGGGAFDGFFAVVMGADPSAVARARAALAAAAARASPPPPPPGGGAAPPAAAAPRLDAFINELPIPGPVFGAALGLDPGSSYYMLLLRSIVGGAGPGALGQFRAFSAAGALRAWRLTPSGGGGGPRASYPLPQVLPRAPPRAAAAVGPPACGGACGAAGGGGAQGEPTGRLLACLMARAAAAPPPLRNNVAARSGAGAPRRLVEGAAAEAGGGGGPGGGGVLEGGGLLAGLAPPLLPLAAAQGMEILQAFGGQPEAAPSAPGGGGGGGVVAAGAPAGGAEALRREVEAALARGGLESEALLQPAYDFLIARVAFFGSEERLRAAHALGAAPPFELLGIDWGLDCVARGLDFCNGDNRDATYVTSWPLVRVDRRGQRLVLAGVNHVAAGTASFCNVALNDPLQRRGLTAFEDADMAGSAGRYLEGTPYEWAAPLLFAVTFSRDCAGIPYCLGLDPASPGANEAPAPDPLGAAAANASATPAAPGAAPPQPQPERGLVTAAAGGGPLLPSPLLIIGRAYVNPLTGVGPAGASLLPFHAMVMTPDDVALPGDTRPRYDSRIFAAPPPLPGGGAEGSPAEEVEEDAAAPGGCMRSMVGMAQCASGSWEACCDAMARWAAAGCWCNQEGQVLLGAMPAALGPAALASLAASCRLPPAPRTCGAAAGGGGRGFP
ncbi:MAG: hypothetical protein J3K34DRAFT_456463 [Monoraphidium minutum]|nr:MAG: hypothetical protein J3K34DRAFT_456463 [Monoraphidium minutum]